MDQLAAMKVFARVAELGSFSSAADALDLSRAMASTQVAALEKRYGVRLLNRTTRKVALTSEGKRFLERCRRVFSELQAAEEDLSRARERPSGRLKVDVPGAFGRYLLMPALPAFLARYPEIEIDVRINDRLVDLIAEQVDVAVRGGTINDPHLIVDSNNPASGPQVTTAYAKITNTGAATAYDVYAYVERDEHATSHTRTLNTRPGV